jgi:hypothetical protein
MRFEVEMTDLQEKIKRLFEIDATTNREFSRNLRHVIDRWIKETDGELQFRIKVTLAPKY